jgi:hypothetical protein
VDNELARSFFQVSADEKRQLNFLLNLRLKELMLNSNRPLMEIMDEMGHYSETQGMTPDLLASLLSEK